MKTPFSLDAVGSLIAGRYRVSQLLGRGGMAAVYKVTDERSGRELALKRALSREAVKNRKQASLLEREYYTLSQLAHPRIIEVYDFGIDPRGPYYTMELLEGRGLEAADRLPWREACAVMRDVASSLAIIHSRGLVHRDVSIRNVRYAADGHVKLLDFGAMMSMGVAKETIGTPPFAAPESVQLQALDARVDLFSLGALGYRLITGKHAFGARSFAELRDVWRSKPTPPSALVADLPAELSSLLLRLLSLDRGGRPQSAPEVISRLGKLADLPQEDSAEISRAYLSAPTLVGRSAALLDVRRRMLGLVRGDGGVLLVRGEVGTGRSRMLDACALEAKLLGCSVLRADARDSGNGDWGVARVLGSQLYELFPNQVREAARLSRNVLGQVIEALRTDEPHTGTTLGSERSLLTRELRDLFLSLCRSQRLVLVVDDVDHIDAASMALLCAIAHRAERHALLLVGSVENAVTLDLPSSLKLLHDLGQSVQLCDLTGADTEALMKSVFGDVANLSFCAALIHQLSHGNPRSTMELAQHLVDIGQARYERGGWVLPRTLDERDLPSSLSDSLAGRLRELSPDAHELAVMLALAEQDALNVASYPALTGHGDAKRVFRALDELVARRILVADAEGYCFAQRGFVSVLQDQIQGDQRADCHLRIVRVLSGRSADLIRRSHHLLHARLEEDAISLLCRLDLAAEAVPLPLLREAIAAAERLQLPASTKHRLRMGLLLNAPSARAFDEFRAVVPVVLKQLERDSGLSRFEELVDVPPAERLAQAVAQTQQAYQEMPEHERIHSVVEAIRELARVCGTIPAIATPSFDLELLESLPDLEPLYPLSPALRVISLVIEASKEWVRGRSLRCRELYEQILLRIGEPDRAGLDESQLERLSLGIQFTLGVLESAAGMVAAEQRAKELERHRSLRVNAWRIRSTLYLALGDVDQARKCQRRAELLQAQEGLRERYGSSMIGIQLLQYARLGDLVSVKKIIDELEETASRHPGWRPMEQLGRSHYAELQGEPATALALAQAAIEQWPPLRHPFWAALAAMRLHALLALGRSQEAAEHARRDLAFCDANGLPNLELRYAAALAISRAGDCETGVAIAEDMLSRSEAYGQRGLVLGIGFEVRAKIAILMGDAESFERCLERCSQLYEPTDNPALNARLSELLEQARAAGVAPSPELAARLHDEPPEASEAEFETLHSRIAECLDGADRCRCALTLLLQATFSNTGYLFVLDRSLAPQLTAALPDLPVDAGLSSWVSAVASEWIEQAEASEVATLATQSVTESETLDSEEAESSRQHFVDGEGRTLEAAPLFDESAGARRLVGVFVQQITPREHITPPRHLCLRIAHELVAYGDAAAASP